MNLLKRINEEGSPTKLAIFRILLGLLVCWICLSDLSAMVHYIRFIGVSKTAMPTVLPYFIDAFTQEHIETLRILLIVASLLFALGVFFKITRVIFFILVLMYYNGITSSIMLHGQWPYLWFLCLVFAFAPAADVLSLDYLLSKKPPKFDRRHYRWPVELCILWLTILYGWAGLAKLLPLDSAHIWMQGNTIRQLVYDRFLISPAYYIFNEPLFNYASDFGFLFAALAILTVVLELSAFMFLFTRKYSFHFILALSCLHIGITLVGVGDFFLVFIVTSFCLWDEKLFDRTDKNLLMRHN